MSDAFQYIDVDSEQFEDAPKALRDAYNKLKKRAQDQDAELGSFRSEKTQATASDVLKAKGYDPKAAKFLIQSGVDLSSESAVDSWLAEDGAFFKVGDPEATPGQTVDHADEAAARQAINTTAAQVTQAASTDKLKLAISEITPDMDGAAVAAVYAKYGV